jgi:class 3 adenylate cyclase
VAHHKTQLAVLFADVSDSTGLYELLGDATAFGIVREVIDLLSEITVASGGRVVKSIGDGLMCAFPSADSAAKAAGNMHWRVAQRPPMDFGEPLTIRVRFRFGNVIRDGKDVFGDTVNIAARMAGLALAEQALTDADTVSALSAQLRDSTRLINSLPVKGKAEPVKVHELLWKMSGVRTVILAAPAPVGLASVREARIRLTHHGEESVFKGSVCFGRDTVGNDVIMTDAMTSRHHAKIELRAGKFVLVDQSSNGTYVCIGGANEICLKREEMILFSSGRFAFGQSTTDPGTEVIEFDCD